MQLFEEAVEALSFWRLRGQKGLELVYFSRHLPVGDQGFPPEVRHWARLRRQGQEPQVDPMAWTALDSENFLYAALLEGWISHLVWVTTEPDLDVLREELADSLDLSVEEYRHLSGLLGSRLTVCTSPPPLERPAAHLDLSFEVPLEETVTMLRALDPCLLSCSLSVSSGAVPASRRYLGPLLAEALKAPEEWLERARRLEAGESPDGPDWLKAAHLFRHGGREAAAELDRGYRLSTFTRGCAAAHQNRWEEARTLLQQAADESPPEAPACRLLLAGLAQRTGRLEEALEMLTDVSDDPRLPRAAVTVLQRARADLLLALERPQEALEVAREAVSADGECPLLNQLLGRCLESVGELEAGARAYRRALRAGAQRLRAGELYRSLVRVYSRLGKPAMAQAERRRLAAWEAR